MKAIVFHPVIDSWIGDMQTTCIPLTVVRVPAEYLHTPDSG